MRSLILLCMLSAALVSQVTAYIELVPYSFGKKAHEMNVSDEARIALENDFSPKIKPELVEQVLETTRVIQGEEGCTWARFTDLLNLLKRDTYPIPLLVKIAIARQFEACNHELTGLPKKDGLDCEERDNLAEFRKRLDILHVDEPKALAKACLDFIEKDHNLTFKHMKKHKGSKLREFGKIFFHEMNFCFTIDDKLHLYYEFVDQVGRDSLDKLPTIVERVEMGLACRAFANKNHLIEMIAFKRTMGKWYNFRHIMKEVAKSDD